MLYQATVVAKGARLIATPVMSIKLPIASADLATGAPIDVVFEMTIAGARWALCKTQHSAGWIPVDAIKKVPFVLVDLYHGDFNEAPPLATIIQPGIHGLLLKATQGTSYRYANTWFKKYWPMTKAMAGDRYGVSFFRGAYHYLEFYKSGKAQAEYFLEAVERAGGWGVGDIIPIVDVEDGGEKSSNRNADAQRIIDVTTDYAETILREHGRRPMLYGGSAIRERKIKNHMGCEGVWVARYSSTLKSDTYTKMGWSLGPYPPAAAPNDIARDFVWGWQYAATERAGTVKGLPPTIPGIKDLVDLTVCFAPTFADIVVAPIKT